MDEASQSVDGIERRREISRSRDLHHLAVEAGGVGTWELSLATGRCRISAQMAKLVGFPVNKAKNSADWNRELSREEWLARVHPEDRPSVLAAIASAASGNPGYRVHFECRLLRPDGTEGWLYSNGSLIEEGSEYLHGASIDVTARRRRDEELKASEERYRRLFESIDQGFCIIEVLFDDEENPIDYRFLELNPAFEKQTSLKNGLGKRVRELVPDLEQFWCDVYGRVAKTGKSVRFQHQARGLGRFFDVNAFRVGAPGENKVAVLFQDISDRKRAEEAILQDARRKDEFLAALAHELRNPLAPIRTGIELMRGTTGESVPIDQLAPTLARQTEQLVRLVDDLLDISRITRAKLPVRQSTVALQGIIESAVESASPLIQAARHRLVVELPERETFVHVDPHRIAQVISNLLDNAAKYTPEGGRIRLRAGCRRKDLIVRVKDDGVGIAREQQGAIFEMFTQLDIPARTPSSGLGLGLTLVKSLVEMHGGTIIVESEGRNKGSEYIVTIPGAVTSPPTAEPGEPEVPETRDGVSPERRTVLVVDDNEDAAVLLKILIERMGHEVHLAGDGLAAVERAERLRPDIVLMDLGMPRMSGYEAAEKIRGQDWGRGMTLIALSGWGRQEDRRKTSDAGFDHHLLKPVPQKELNRVFSTIYRSAS